MQLVGLIDDLERIYGSRDGLNSQSGIWRFPGGRQIEFGSCKNLGDESKYRGRAHDLKCFDEICHFTESQFRFLGGWLRTTNENQRCRVVCAGNPPLKAEERWVVQYWAPWLDTFHDDYPAPPGELRWYTVVDGEEVEVDGPEEFEHDGQVIRPKSRTFIPAKVQDNPYLAGTDYEATLQAMLEPLRSQLLLGDFFAGTQDDPYQVIPTAWVDAAMDRWKPRDPKGPMDSIGLDPARGGRDQEVLARRHGVWFDELLVFPGEETPDGPTTASRVLLHRRDGAPVHIDPIGVGASPYDFLKGNGVQTVPLNNATASTARDRTGTFSFRNLRAELWWRMREALDPQYDMGIALPPDPELRADLCSATWAPTVRGIQVGSKDEIKKRIGRSPGKGDAVVMALRATPKTSSGVWTRPRKAKIICHP